MLAQTMLDELLARIADKKEQLDALRPLSRSALAQLQKHHDVELTYTSNAIEGNTLTLRETAEVIEHGLTIGGKPLRDHLEALDHYDAVLWMRDLADAGTTIDDATVCELHRRIVLRSRPDIAGFYSRLPRRIAGSSAIFPSPAKVPDLMEQLGAWLTTMPGGSAAAFEAHYRLTAIHPFADGNGRTARLLMNLVLLLGGTRRSRCAPRIASPISTRSNADRPRTYSRSRLSCTLGSKPPSTPTLRFCAKPSHPRKPV